jgi:hypothetical protein
MDIRTVAIYLRQGYRIRRSFWALGPPKIYAYEQHEILWLGGTNDGEVTDCPLTIDDLLADDWEIITEGIVKDFPLTYSD